ncbi:MAG: hypothetical protein ACUVTE_07830 [Candidatus Bathycorpusculaceae bacterium]
MPKKSKHIFIDVEVWKQLHKLRAEWEKNTLSDVIDELLKRSNVERA